jgi:hypothetical protein
VRLSKAPLAVGKVLKMLLSHDEAKLKLLKAAADLYAGVSRAFTQDPDHPRTVANERERYGPALVVVAQFFSGLGDRRIGDRFFELASAITDLNTGTLHPLLHPARADNRRADTSQLWRARARAVLALEALVRSGIARKAATAKLARTVNAAKLAGAKAKTSNLQTTILGWRKGLLEGRVKNFEGRELLLAGRDKIRDLPKNDPRLVEFAEHQLAELAEPSGVLSPHS